ncbi:Hypothetical protein CINCED_3A021169 [Cinara cedri]|uniref:MIF4G domain-containing protein n=1 Tax=Cinara cedri TaxID=506608 RepID=A0A5E4NDH8_9HEMI|nr:Hypothetical protein CINCED_3A021169 [Cinara cedri]
MDSNGGGYNNNNYRKYKRGNGPPANPKTKKQLENELNRQRSFYVPSAATAATAAAGPQNHHHHRVAQDGNNTQGDYSNRNSSNSNCGGVTIGQKKPTLAIYRPPTNGPQKSRNIKDVASNMSADAYCKLNVHAKEFSLERSKTAPQSIMNGAKPDTTQHNGSTTPMLSRSRTFYTNGEIKPNSQKKSFEYKGYKNNFQQTNKNMQMQKDVQGPKVQFKEPKRKSKPAVLSDEVNKSVTDSKIDYTLRRSKSYNGPDSKYYQNTSEETNNSSYKIHQTNEFCIKDLSCFPEDINDMAKRIVKDTNNSPTKDLMLLALKIIEHVVSKEDALNPSVNLSLFIIERDTRETYVNMIINTIQLWFVKREKLLQPPRFCAYATYVLKMYTGMKQNKVLSNRMEKEVYSRKQSLLILLFKICEHCLTPTKEEDAIKEEEAECLFDIVNAVGRDLEQEVPDMVKQLYVAIRDVMLTRDCSTSTKKILLHLIELKASAWALPPSTINYYSSKTNI